VKEMSEYEQKIRKQAEKTVEGIINGNHFYGQVELSIVHFGRRYRLVGDIGVSASVGQLIRAVEDRKRLRNPVVGIVWLKVPRSPKQNDYLIAFELDFWGGDPDQTIYYICGGMTDYSGEGGRAYDAMKFYIERYEHVPVTTIVLTDYPDKNFSQSKDLINYLDKKLAMLQTNRLAKQ
jgi:hypothetical protein